MTFSNFASHLEKIEATAKRNDMTTLLVRLLKETPPSEIDSVVYLSLGQLAPLYLHKEFGLAEKMVIRAIARAYHKDESVVKDLYKKTGDLGIVAESLFSHPFRTDPDFSSGKSAGTPEPRTERSTSRERIVPLKASAKLYGAHPSVSSVFSALTTIAEDSGEGSQQRKLDNTAELLQSLTPLGARYVVRIILDKLRLGFSDKTVLDALSVMTRGDKSGREQIEAAYNVRPDVGWLAKEIKHIASVGSPYLPHIPHIPHLGIPVLPALCQRLPTTEEIVKKMGEVAVEPKWDGQRIQAHVGLNTRSKIKNQKSKMSEVHLFARSLEDVTDMFPDLVNALYSFIQHSVFSIQHCILDGEVVGVDPKTGRVLPFQTMITRKRKYGIAEHLKSVPIRYMVFDILSLNNESLMEKPFSKRRQTLEQIFSLSNLSNLSNLSLSLAPQLITSDPAEIRTFLKEQIDSGLEGVVAKQIDAPYSPGRTGFTWVKMKWEGNAKTGGLLDTIDCVVMGIYAGRGKRSSFGVGAFLVGILSSPDTRYPTLSTILTISKIGTGLSDEQWRELKVQSAKFKVQSCPKEYIAPKSLMPDAWLEPKIVVEIQADNITKSPLHTAGFALRFPRLVRYRTDKQPEQITTLKEVKRLYKMQ